MCHHLQISARLLPAFQNFNKIKKCLGIPLVDDDDVWYAQNKEGFVKSPWQQMFSIYKQY